MSTPEGSFRPIRGMMHVHSALNEVVDRAFQSLMTPDHYHHMMEHSQELVTAYAAKWS